MSRVPGMARTGASLWASAAPSGNGLACKGNTMTLKQLREETQAAIKAADSAIARLRAAQNQIEYIEANESPSEPVAGGYSFAAWDSGPHKTWAVYTPAGDLLCVCVYKRGANSLVNHLNTITKGY